jgi:Flp pilus assembly protein TadG
MAIHQLMRQVRGNARRWIEFLSVPRMRGQQSPAGRKRSPRSILREEGQSTVELAIALPFLLSFIFGLMQVCIAFYIYESMSELAREGTRYAMVHGASCVTSSSASCTATAAEIESYVNSIGLLNSGAAPMTVTASFPDGNENVGSRVQVVVKYTFPFNVPFMKSTSLSMSSTSEMYILQ